MKKINILVLMQEPCPTIIKLIQGVRLLAGNRINIITVSEHLSSFSIWEKLGYEINIDGSVYNEKTAIKERMLKYLFLQSAKWQKIFRRYEQENIHIIQTITPDYIPVLAKKYMNKPVFHHFREIQSLFPHYLLYKGLKKRFVSLKKLLLKRLENEAIRCSDVVSCDSGMSLQEIIKKLPNKKETLVLRNAPLSIMIPEQKKPKVSSHDSQKTLVYHGHINEGALDFIGGLCQKGIQFHIYPLAKSKEIMNKLNQMKHIASFHLHENIVGYKNFIFELSQYDYGLIPPSSIYQKERFFNTYLPCKVFDYIAAGLTVLTGNYDQIRNFVEEQKAGFIIDSTDDVLNILEKGYNSNITPITVDEEIKRLISLYEHYAENSNP